jgi:hypothetical protein
VLAALLAACGQRGLPEAVTGNLQVSVEGVDSAEVSVLTAVGTEAASATVTADDAMVFEDLTVGVYTVTATEQTGFVTPSVPATVVAGETVPVTLTFVAEEPEEPEVDSSVNALEPQPETTNDPDTVTAASGSITVDFSGEGITLGGSYTNLTSAPIIAAGEAEAHIHYRGELFDVPVEGDQSAGTFGASFSYDAMAGALEGVDAATVEEELRSGNWAYFNLHTETNPAGEVYAWVTDQDDLYAEGLVPQPATADDPDTVTTATGTFATAFSETGVTVSGSYQDLTSAPIIAAGDAEAHIHYLGQLFDVPVMGDAASGSFEATFTFDEMAAALAAADLDFDAATVEQHLGSGNWAYFNLHTQDNPGGEVYAFVRAAVTAE